MIPLHQSKHIRKGLHLSIDMTCNLLKVPPRSWFFWLVFGAGSGQWFDSQVRETWNIWKLDIKKGNFIKLEFD